MILQDNCKDVIDVIMSVTDSLNSESEDVVGGSLVIVCMTSNVKMTTATSLLGKWGNMQK